MTSLITQPELLAAAADDLAGIRAALSQANAAAAGSTTSLAAAAADEVSAACAQLFSTYGRESQALLTQLSALQGEFNQLLAASGLAYVEAEVANAAAVARGALGSLTSPIQSLLGGGAAASAGGAVTSAGTAAPLVTALSTPERTVSLIMGASGLPIPPPAYVEQLLPLYYHGELGSLIGLPTPEGLYPLTGIKDLTLNVSAARGAQILHDAILQQIPSDVSEANPFTINILGYSQSSTISSMVMAEFNPSNTPGGSTLPAGTNLHFTLLGDPSNPNGGLLARFPGLNLPSLGITMGNATPDNSFPTDIYTIQYDGFGDFPQYPINILADANAFLGIIELHGKYPYLTPLEIAGATELPRSADVLTHYYMIDTGHFPLTDFIRDIPIVGNPIANLIEPDLRVLVNLGYGSVDTGYSQGNANVQTPFGLFPDVPISEILAALGTGTQQGVSAFAADINTMLATPPSVTLAPLTQLATNVSNNLSAGFATVSGALSSPDSFINALEAANARIASATATTISSAYATLLPTADVATALLLSVPSYNFNLRLDGLEMMLAGDVLGGLQYATVAPMAVNGGIYTLCAGFEFRVLQHAASDIINAWTGNTPPPPGGLGGPQV